MSESLNPYPVAPAGFFFGLVFGDIFIGLLAGQISTYLSHEDSIGDSWWRKCIVAWVALLGFAHVLITSASGYHYYVRALNTTGIWNYFYWALSAQDMLIPLISYTAHLYFGYRCWALIGKRKWTGRLIFAFSTITFLLGVTFAITSGIWAHNPFVTVAEFQQRKVGGAANILPTIWLCFAAAIDLFITGTLVIRLATAQTGFDETRRLLARVVVLTLETVLLTHLCGLVLFVLWLTSRTRSDAFWVLLSVGVKLLHTFKKSRELIAPTYLLSIMVTVNSRARLRQLAQRTSELATGEFIIHAKSELQGSIVGMHELTKESQMDNEETPVLV